MMKKLNKLAKRITNKRYYANNILIMNDRIRVPSFLLKKHIDKHTAQDYNAHIRSKGAVGDLSTAPLFFCF